jgi:hypothetical protein
MFKFSPPVDKALLAEFWRRAAKEGVKSKNPVDPASPVYRIDMTEEWGQPLDKKTVKPQ